MRRASPPPQSLVEDGRFVFGVFDGPIAHVNPLDARRPFGVPLPRAVRAFRLKEWQAFQLVDDRVFVMLALFDAKTIALAQVKVYDWRTGDKHVFERKLPPWALKVAQGLLDSETRFAGAGCQMLFRNRLGDGHIDIDIDVAPTRTFPGLRGHLVARTEGVDPLVVAIPFADNRGMYSHKGALPVQGELRLGGVPIAIDPEASLLLMDDHKGFYPFVMRWDWVTGAGRDAQGRRLALNLTRNQSIDLDRFNENCVWIDGRAHLLPAVSFERTGFAVGDRWTVRDRGGQVDLVFTVRVEGRVDVNALVVKTDYQGPFGTFEGTLRADDGAEARVDGLFGMGERFFLRC